MELNKRIPSGEDVANLLLLCAPQSILNDFCLTEKDKNEFIKNYDSLENSPENNFYKIESIVTALYFATKSRANYVKSFSIVNGIYIDPGVLYGIVAFARNEEFIDVENIRKEICGTGGKKANKLNREEERIALEYYDANRWIYKSPRAVANDICNGGKK